MEKTQVVLITLISYKLLLLAIGAWASRRTRSSDDFFLGGRGLGPWVAAISYSASSASAWTLLGMSGLAYSIGLASVWVAAGAVLGAAVAWIWIAPRLMQQSRALGQVTLTDFLAQDAGAQALTLKRIASAIVLFCFVFYVSSQFQGAGNTFASTFDMSSANAIILGGAIIVIYTFMGGFWAVSLTDTLQGLLMLVAAVAVPLMAFVAADGWRGISATLAHQPALLVLSGTHTGLAAAGFVAGGLAVGIGAYGQPHLLNRFMALRDQRALRQARVIAIAWFALVFFGMVLLGLAGRALLPSLSNPETLFFALTDLLFEPWLGAILLAAVLSAIMSTADSMLLVASACVCHDLNVARRFPGRELWLARLTMVWVSVLAIAIAIGLPASIFHRVLFAWIALGSAFGPLVFVRLAGIRVTGVGAIRALLTGFGLAVLLFWLPDTPGDWLERLLPFCAGLVVLLKHRQI